MTLKTALLAVLALFAFAGNSVLCRLALSDSSIDPASFTGMRLGSGALTLWLIAVLSNFAPDRSASDSSILSRGWLSPLMLFSYAALFSFAYLSLDTGVGALILFGSVQITMVFINLSKGNRLAAFEWLGLLVACSGLLYLVYPELSKPSLLGFVMMSMAGVAWGVYTVQGQGSLRPLTDTASNFIKSVPMAMLLLLPFLSSLQISFSGVLLAIASGAITSGLGYAVWYAALRGLNTTQAGVLQLLVPIIAAVGGVIFAGESLTLRLLIASVLTLGGILLVMLFKNAQQKN